MSNFTLPESLEYKGIKINLLAQDETRIQNALTYLINYGFGKSLQDSVAGIAKEEKAKGTTQDEIDAIIANEMVDRAEAIFAGTLGSRTPRATGPEAVRRTVIEEWFKAWLASKGKSLPSVKSKFGVSAKDSTKEQRKAVADEIATIKEKWAAHPSNAERIAAEVADRLAKAKESGAEEDELDLDDLLA